MNFLDRAWLQLYRLERTVYQVCDYSRPPFAKWFVGKTNLRHNAVDRHAAKRPNDRAVILFQQKQMKKQSNLLELQREVETHGCDLQGES